MRDIGFLTSRVERCSVVVEHLSFVSLRRVAVGSIVRLRHAIGLRTRSLLLLDTERFHFLSQSAVGTHDVISVHDSIRFL